MTKIILAAVACAGLFAHAESPGYSPPSRDGEARALENARRGNQEYIENLIQREINRRKSSSAAQRWANCGTSYWTKREARAMCPADTIMKVQSQDEVFYTCDCE